MLDRHQLLRVVGLDLCFVFMASQILAPYHGHSPKDVPSLRGKVSLPSGNFSGEKKRECLAKHFSLRLGSAL